MEQMDANTNKQYQSTSELEGEMSFPLSLFRICALCVCVCTHVCKLPHCGPDCADVQCILAEGCDQSVGRLRR